MTRRYARSTHNEPAPVVTLKLSQRMDIIIR